uniref:Uncharacterized protein n=1 Tax=uncultured marine virus TaxID=186617 RepID=A0A0F7L8Z4_9VIRU|nr:hypothetical protein [uncultured marine virus]
MLFLFGATNVKCKEIDNLVKLLDQPVIDRSRCKSSDSGTRGNDHRDRSE